MITLISKRKKKKYTILNTLRDTSLCIEDIEMYTKLDRLDIVPLIQDFLRWGDIDTSGKERYITTGKNRKLYTTTKKGEQKLKYFKTKYGFK